MEIKFVMQLLAFGLVMNIIGAIRYKLLGGKADDILIVMIWVNLSMFVFSAFYYSFSIILFLAMLFINFFYIKIYYKFKRKD